jgi:hypothetical protein
MSPVAGLWMNIDWQVYSLRQMTTLVISVFFAQVQN